MMDLVTSRPINDQIIFDRPEKNGVRGQIFPFMPNAGVSREIVEGIEKFR